ncbi:helix-turn-helix domain-containing protein [Brevibacillus laterosporus]|uniref:helix-turn-helix domain-containing protein n=1 Tax=Brevibacillus laterosporus TaxID=1465 RepID=UPI001443D1A5|nr:helix-turn-helix transcriptional regulator [Brevibacillus laterosporus]NKQ22484.1 helix-turn-helix transcriptional regulator [Brevibacillus laterosporus]WNX29179.1 helix-turn-helix transcriptional regulator [Brevibacillus laterosporus]
MAESLSFLTFGGLIKDKRTELGISLSELSRLSGISKGVLSKIETGKTKRPKLSTLKSLMEVLKFPYDEVIKYYVESEDRIDVLHAFLLEAIELHNLSLISKVANHFLSSPRDDTYNLLESLYEFANTCICNEVKLSLYDEIVQYARQHGVPKYMAKGLYKTFFIKVQELDHLEEVFKLGEEILYYKEFLNQEESIKFLYRMAFLAHDLKKYEKCIQLGRMGHAEDTTENEIKERVALAICNSYMFEEKYDELENQLQLYKKLGYKFICDRIKFFRAIILARTGNEKEAIPLLKECVAESTENNRLHRVNELIEALLRINDLDSLQHILEQEEKNTTVIINTPYKYSELGKYFKHKGMFLVKHGFFSEGMEAYLASMKFYSEIHSLSGLSECSEEIYIHHCEQNKDMHLGLLNKLREVYNVVNKGCKRGDIK